MDIRVFLWLLFFLAVGGGFTVGPATIREIKQKKRDKLAAYLASIAKYSKEDKSTLYVYKRSPEISQLVKIVDDKDVVYQYEPEKIHFGAVTVGNVTTGGSYKTGGCFYEAGMIKNGKSILRYCDDNDILTIRLTEELYQQAKSSSIEKYLRSPSDIEVVTKWWPSNMATRLMMQGNYTMFQKEFKEHYPSYEKCAAIMNWLCNPDMQ